MVTDTAMGIAQVEMVRTVKAGMETGTGTRTEMGMETAIMATKPSYFDPLRLRKLRHSSRRDEPQMCMGRLKLRP
jgi:hypothetical protein